MKTSLLVTLLLFAIGILTANAQQKHLVTDTTLARKWYDQAVSLQQKGSYDSSNVLFEKASALYQKHRQWAQQLDCDNRFSRSLISMGKFEETLQKAGQTLRESLTKLGVNNTREADTYNIIGNVYNSKGEYDKGLEYHYKALKIRQQILGDAHPSVAASYNNIGNVYQNKGEYEKALACHYKALQIRRNALGKDHPDVATSYNNIGCVYEAKGEYDKALEYYDKDLQISLKTLGKAHPEVADSYNNIGLVYQNKGEYDKALEYFYKSLQIKHQTLGEIHPLVATSYNNVGNIYKTEGEYDKALEYHQKTLQILLKVLGEAHPDVADSYINIGEVYEAKGEYGMAVEYYQRALQIRRKALGENHPKVADSYYNIGGVYKVKGEYDQALEFYQKALQLDVKFLGKVHPDVADIYNNIGSVYEQQGQYEIALQQFQQAILANVPSFQDTLLTHNPRLTLPASPYLDGSFLLASLQAKASALQKLFTQSQAISDLQLAYQSYCSADTLAQQLQQNYARETDKVTFTATAGQGYQKAIPLCLKLSQLTKDQTYLNQAFYFAERGKASVLSATLAESKAKTFAGIADSLLAQDQQLRKAIAQASQQVADQLTQVEGVDSSQLQAYQSQLFAAHSQQEQLISQLEKAYPQYYRLKYQPTTISPPQLQAALDEKTAVVDYVVGDSLLQIFTLTRRSYEVYSRPLDSRFHRQLAALREALLSQDQELYQQVAYPLYQTLLPSSLPKSIQQLIIIPEGELTSLPFEALLTQDAKAGKAKAYLLNQYAISYAYSARLLYERLTQPQQAAAQQLLALAPVFADTLTNILVAANRGVLTHHQPSQLSSSAVAERSHQTRLAREVGIAPTGHPATLRGQLLDGQYVAPLLASQREVTTIADLFRAKGGLAEVYLHGQASEERLKSREISRYTYLHLATHGFVNESYPELSGLLLAQDNTSGEDGIVYTGEIYNLRLQAELVTLSACETGLGKLARGEGVIGLTRALLYAGARNVMVSFWKVPDESTADLMEAFYAQLLNGQDKAGALQEAKRQLVRQGKYAQPFYWAPFILVGK